MYSRLTKIVCTIGPASSSEEKLRKLIDAGMSVARVNMSHGDRASHEALVKRLQELREETGIPFAIMLDTKGNEIRTGSRQVPLPIKQGEGVLFYPPSLGQPEGTKAIQVSYDSFADDVKETETILIDNGELSFDILAINTDGTVSAKAREDGEIGDCRHINLPGADIDEPTITESDWSDIDFAITANVDFIALSFIRSEDEVQQVRTYLEGKKSSMRIVSKIETRQSVENIDAIIEESDGLMVARGDLGAEIPFESLPALQDDIVAKCVQNGKPVIIATHMLESMNDHPLPTRAEMTDVAHAATTKVDATMLSSETASGKHPVKSVQVMDKLLRTTEAYSMASPHAVHVENEYEARAEAAVSLTETTNASAILVFTRTGLTANQICKFRPNVPIIACTNDPAVQRQMSLLYGVAPCIVTFSDSNDMYQQGLSLAEELKLASKGEKVILISDIPKEKREWNIQLRYLA